MTQPRILALHCHPDDIEILCAGTLVLLKEAGCPIVMATMTSGDCGSATQGPEEIMRIRRSEAVTAAERLGAEYHCLEFFDLAFYEDHSSRCRVVELLRKVRPDVIITSSPQDYMPDHEITSKLVTGAAFGAPVPNFRTGSQNPAAIVDHIPHVYYCDPIEGIDQLGNPITPHFYVDVTTSIEMKVEMLCCHASQREWLRAHHGMDEYIKSMREWSAHRGREAGVAEAEGFRQHRGHGYPRNNILAELLGNRVISV